VDVVAGGYEDWERQRAAQDSRSSRTKPKGVSNGAAPVVTRDEPKARPAKLSFKDQRDLDLLPARVEALTTAIARDEAALADPRLYMGDPARFDALTKAIAEARAERDAAEERWLEVAGMAEALA
jgi:ATP-binding cassette subfamily F protein uup